GEMSLHGIAEGNGAEAGRNWASGCRSRIGGAENGFKIHEPARSKVRLADAEGKRRLLRFVLRRSIAGHRGSWCGSVGVECRVFHVRRAGPATCGQALLQLFDLLLLLRHLLLLLLHFWLLLRDLRL